MRNEALWPTCQSDFEWSTWLKTGDNKYKNDDPPPPRTSTISPIWVTEIPMSGNENENEWKETPIPVERNWSYFYPVVKSKIWDVSDEHIF